MCDILAAVNPFLGIPSALASGPVTLPGPPAVVCRGLRAVTTALGATTTKGQCAPLVVMVNVFDAVWAPPRMWHIADLAVSRSTDPHVGRSVRWAPPMALYGVLGDPVFFPGDGGRTVEGCAMVIFPSTCDRDAWLAALK